MQQKLREKSISLDLSLSSTDDDRIYTDENLLEQTFYNLLLNAIDAAPSNSELSISTTFSASTPSVMISDEGSGMPFSPDVTSLSPRPITKRFGTGLGIPFVFKVCEALSGKVTFSTRTEGGTLVELVLPRRIKSSEAEENNL